MNHVGDALIAAFNAPLPIDAHPAQAVDAARSLLSLVSDARVRGPPTSLRIGVATGPVAAGTVGGAGRQTYTLYGDTVNLAQRLEELNKELEYGLPDLRHDLHGRGSNCVDAVAMGSCRCVDAEAPSRSLLSTVSRRSMLGSHL